MVNYQRDIRTFLTATGQIQADEFQRCAAAWLNLRRQTLAPKTIGRNLSSLKAFAKTYDLKLTTLDEYRLPTPLPSKPHPLPGGIPDVRRMVSCAYTSDHEAVVALCGLGGLRISEACAVRVSHIDFPARKLSVLGKGQKERIVPISPEMWESIVVAYMNALAKGPDARLVNHEERAARRAITAIGKRAGIGRPVASHDLRATFATAVLHRTKNVRLVQELLGHSSIKTTQLYLGIDDDELADSVAF